MKKTTIAVIDDHKLIRDLWIKVFSSHPEYEIIGESGELADAIEMIKIKKPDIAFLDINLAQHSGMDAVPQIRKYSPGTKIIVVTMHNQPALAKKMFQLGVKGYVTKNSSHKELVTAVIEVIAGEIYVCNEIKNTLAEQVLVSGVVAPDIKDLSLREIEIIKLLRQGNSSKEISAVLNIATRTVEVHRHNILKKLNLKNTTTLLNFIQTTDLYD